MRIPTIAVLTLTIGLTACGSIRDSRVNPVNWFGKGRAAPVQTEKANDNPLIPTKVGLFAKKRIDDAVFAGQPIDRVTKLVIERVPGGAIIRATGVTATQGVHGVQLTPNTPEELPVDGVLTYRLEGLRPGGSQPVGSEFTRTVVVARALTDQQLQGVRTIRIEAARNAQAARRR